LFQVFKEGIFHTFTAKVFHYIVIYNVYIIVSWFTQDVCDIVSGVYCPKVTTLDLSGVAVTMKSMQVLTGRCVQLKVCVCLCMRACA